LFPVFAVSVLLALSMAGCTRSDVPEVSLEKRSPVADQVTSVNRIGLRIGMGAMITPKEGYVYYNRLKEYLARELQMPVTLVDRENYAEMNKLLANGGVDTAFVCAGPYVEGHEQFGLELLAMPLVKGKPVYHSYIIVPKDSTAVRLDDLRGKRFAFTDPQSNSGKLVPTYLLARRNTTPEEFFGKVSYTYGHDKSIQAVAEKLVDGAAVDSLIWEYLNRTKPALTSMTRIIDISEPYGIPPLVVRKDLSPELKKRLLKVLLAMPDTAAGREILAGMMIDRFVPGDDSNYDSIRAINRWIAGQKQGSRK
jgi:phosphonate transport system substrate-binding protein